MWQDSINKCTCKQETLLPRLLRVKEIWQISAHLADKQNRENWSAEVVEGDPDKNRSNRWQLSVPTEPHYYQCTMHTSKVSTIVPMSGPRMLPSPPGPISTFYKGFQTDRIFSKLIWNMYSKGKGKRFHLLLSAKYICTFGMFSICYSLCWHIRRKSTWWRLCCMSDIGLDST